MPLPVRAAIVALACLTALVALSVREESAIGVALEAAATSPTVSTRADRNEGPLTWGSYDPDTLYHARRVARAVQNAGWVSSYDPFLAYPGGLSVDSPGTAIPWPPAYDLLLTTLVRRRLPSMEALLPPEPTEVDPGPPGVAEPLLPATRRRIEQLVASVPMWCGALTALIAALASAGLARTLVPAARSSVVAIAAALVAGLTVAFTFGHVRYSHLGNGDHHAFISLLHLALLAIVGSSLRPDRIIRPVGSAARGGAAGLIAGLMITSWTASILWVALVQLALVLRLALPFRDERGLQSARGLPLFATTFHKAALLIVMPAAIESPFSSSDPFSLIELSWFHMVWLAIGWLIFAPYALLPRFAAGRRFAAMLPAVALAAVLLFGTDTGAGLVDAISWAGAENPFMGGINESQPLVGSFPALLRFAGAGVLLAPLVWALALRQVRTAPQLLPWVISLPVLLLFALLQRRFAEGLTAPMAVLLGSVLSATVLTRLGRAELRLAGALGLGLLAIAANPSTVNGVLSRGRTADPELAPFVTWTDMARRQRAQAALLQAMRDDAPRSEPLPVEPLPSDPLRSDFPPSDPLPLGVLAEWDLGHSIEWRAERPTVATNFGLYLGEASFLAPWRFFAETDEAAALQMLQQLGVGSVIIDRRTAARRSEISAALGLGERGEEFWSRTMGARLVAGGESAATQHPGFMRLVRWIDASVASGGMRAYDVVRGARLRAEGGLLQVMATLADERGSVFTWRAAARAGAGGGELEVRVPYGSPASLPGEDPMTQRPESARVRVLDLEIFLDGEAVPVSITDWDVENGLSIDVNI